MSQEDSGAQSFPATPEVQIQTGRGFSIIWVVPIIALLIGGWLTYKAMSEKGPVITITFESAEGLEAGKTSIKYKDLEIGKVSKIELKEDLSGLVVTAEMHRDTERYMTDKTEFWVVRARVAAGEVSGLGTLFSGAYIGCNPASAGVSRRAFSGLEKPPALTGGLPGRHFILQSASLGSLDLGSPVYYRGVKVGRVVDYNFDITADSIQLKVFINAPFHEKVRQHTRFWNASGVDFTVDATGVKLDTQSLVSILLGGISFDTRDDSKTMAQAEENSTFRLFENYQSSTEESYAIKRYYWLYFDQTVRGLSPKAPVEIKGIKVGEVVNVELQFDLRTEDFRIPVLIMIEPQRINALITKEGKVVKNGEASSQILALQQDDKANKRIQLLVDKGLRAQLKTGNLLTGQLYVDLDFYRDAIPEKLAIENGYQVLPTMPTAIMQIVDRVDHLLKAIEQIQFDKIGQSVETAVKDLSTVLLELKSLFNKINSETMPQINNETLPKLNTSLDELKETLAGIDQMLGPNSALNYNTRKITDEFSTAIRSLRSLLDLLERDPQALLLGKEGEKK
jgi:paraquat-inducible protein B